MVLLKELFEKAMKEGQPRKKISKKSKKIGVNNVYKVQCGRCKQGYQYVYRYIDETGKRRALCSIDLNKLEKRVKEQGLQWTKIKNK